MKKRKAAIAVMASIVGIFLLFSAYHADLWGLRREVWALRKSAFLTVLSLRNWIEGREERPACVPILMYHSISEMPPGEAALSVRPEDFERQMQYLVENGYTAIGFDELAEAGRFKKPILITFDDGYADNFEQAYPILQEYGLEATVFVVSDYIDSPGYLSAEQMRQMADSVSFQSHTASHRALPELPPEELARELTDSQEKLADITGQMVDVLAYPEGEHNAAVRRMAARCFHYAVCTRFGYYFSGTAPYEIHRIAVARDENLTAFAEQIS
jgi:peptidoglycan/xylan/chitin deacetylase (PgdA/CDA1 family)